MNSDFFSEEDHMTWEISFNYYLPHSNPHHRGQRQFTKLPPGKSITRNTYILPLSQFIFLLVPRCPCAPYRPDPAYPHICPSLLSIPHYSLSAPPGWLRRMETPLDDSGTATSCLLQGGGSLYLVLGLLTQGAHAFLKTYPF